MFKKHRRAVSGVIGNPQVDDHGHWEGCRRALDEFEKEQNVVFEITIIDEIGISFRKP